MKTKGEIRGTLKCNEKYKADPREVKLQKILNKEGGEDLEDGVFPIIYTNKKDGVLPEYDIRTDRFEVALDAIDKMNRVTMSEELKRMENTTNKGLKNDEGSGTENANAPVAGQS